MHDFAFIMDTFFLTACGCNTGIFMFYCLSQANLLVNRQDSPARPDNDTHVLEGKND